MLIELPERFSNEPNQTADRGSGTRESLSYPAFAGTCSLQMIG